LHPPLAETVANLETLRPIAGHGTSVAEVLLMRSNGRADGPTMDMDGLRECCFLGSILSLLIAQSRTKHLDKALKI
jgi:hypothetical protein